MKGHHYLTMFVLLLIGYYAGTKWPSLFSGITSKF